MLVTEIAYHSVPCAVYGFDNRNPAPNAELHCDYGPVRTTTLANSHAMGPLSASSVIVPSGSPGSATRNVQTGAGNGVATDGSGSFRTTCGLAKMDFVDPIAFPKTGYNMGPANVQPMPTGLRIIAGDKNATAAQFVSPLQLATWSCRDAGGEGATIPVSCPTGDAVRLTIIFPQCWDGTDLDSPNHKSHMAYPDYSSARTRHSTDSLSIRSLGRHEAGDRFAVSGN